jgi:hypothetical protein
MAEPGTRKINGYHRTVDFQHAAARVSIEFIVASARHYSARKRDAIAYRKFTHVLPLVSDRIARICGRMAA